MIKSKYSYHNKGVTLIEVTIYVSLLGLFCASVFSLLLSLINVQNKVSNDREEAQLSYAVSAFEEDLDHMIPCPAGSGLHGGLISGSKDSVLFLSSKDHPQIVEWKLDGSNLVRKSLESNVNFSTVCNNTSPLTEEPGANAAYQITGWEPNTGEESDVIFQGVDSGSIVDIENCQDDVNCSLNGVRINVQSRASEMKARTSQVILFDR